MMNGYEYTGMDAILAGSFRAAIYCRLSKDDDLDGESASIANQRDMLESYCEKQGWEVVAVYQDDGYTGLNMERPDLKRMLKAIERRQANLVITKDLSRLGRNYLQTGFLIEDFFPRHGVRYIAMNDGIDTMRDNNDIAPFKNILNEMFSLRMEALVIQYSPRIYNKSVSPVLSVRPQSAVLLSRFCQSAGEAFHGQGFPDCGTAG